MIKFQSRFIKYPFLVFLCIFGYLLCFTRLGVDFTDCGFHIQCGYEAWYYHSCLSWMCFLTHVAGGLWQGLSPVGKSLQWVYIGGCVLWGVIGVCIFFILKTIFRLPDYILAICSFGAFLSVPIFQLDMLIQYYTFSLLLCMVYCFFFVRLVCKTGNTLFQAWLLGLFYILMIASRFPLILFGGIPVFYYLLKGFVKRDWAFNGKMVLCFCLGCFTGILFMTPLVWAIKFHSVDTNQHWFEVFGWIRITIRETVYSWSIVFPFLAGCWVLSLFPASKKVLVFFMFLAVLFAVACFAIMYRYPSAVDIMRFKYLKIILNGMAMVLIVGVFINNFCRTWYYPKTDLNLSDTDFLLLVLTLFVVYCIFPLGTNTGAVKNYYTLFLLFAIFNVLLWSSIIGNGPLKKTCPILLLLILPLLGIASTLNYSYREDNKMKLSIKTDIPCLKNIKTSNLNYAEELSTAYAGIHPFVRKGETMLVTGNSYLWNWILDTKTYTKWAEYRPLEKLMIRPDIVLPDSILLIKKSTENFAGYNEHLDWWKESFLPGRYTNVYSDDYCEFYRKNQ